MRLWRITSSALVYTFSGLGCSSRNLSESLSVLVTAQNARATTGNTSNFTFHICSSCYFRPWHFSVFLCSFLLMLVLPHLLFSAPNHPPLCLHGWPAAACLSYRLLALLFFHGKLPSAQMFLNTFPATWLCLSGPLCCSRPTSTSTDLVLRDCSSAAMIRASVLSKPLVGFPAVSHFLYQPVVQRGLIFHDVFFSFLSSFVSRSHLLDVPCFILDSGLGHPHTPAVCCSLFCCL